MANQTPTPRISKDLLDWLERTFPDKLPVALNIDERTIWSAIGEQRVVRKLRSLFEEQNRNILVSSED